MTQSTGDDLAPRPSPHDPHTPHGLRVLVTGSTGYVGSRLVPELAAAGHRVLAATRNLDHVREFAWAEQVEPTELDIGDDDQLARAVEGAQAVVYLVHSMESEDFVEKDRRAAERMATACARAGVEHLVYLSGLIPDEPIGQLSDHLRSRLEVEQVFLDSTVPTTVLRAAMVIGAGSTSYELLRRLSERVPLLTPVPAWMRRRLQPVAIEDVVHVVSRALLVGAQDRHYDVGGDEVVTYPELLALYADVAGLKRRRFLVPWVPRAVVGRACALISRLDRPTVESLVDSLSHEMVCREDAVRRDLCEPGFVPAPLREALVRSHRGSVDHSLGNPGGTSREGDVQAGATTDPA